MAGGRGIFTATLLPSGAVLVIGGFNGEVGVASAELFDAATGVWTPTEGLHEGRFQHTATLLPDGSVLVAGGSLFPGSDALGSAEIYIP
jgi:hypothetical protein